MNSQELLQLYRSGQDAAAAAIFDRYLTRLLALVRSRLGPSLQRRLDPEDVVQSAYRSFFLRASQGEYDIAQAGDLWRLLASIALNKLYRQVERHTAAKRGLDREVAVDTGMSQLASAEPTPAEVVAVVEELQLLASTLTTEEQTVVSAMLADKSTDEIAAMLGTSPRTARRLVGDLKQRFERRLVEQPSAERPKVIHQSPPEAPLRYADYVLEQLIAAGGMGKVFRARCRQTGELVAIKALHKRWQSEDRATDRFVQEAQILSRLRHPNIVGLRGLGRFPSGGYFIVMDYIAGTDLQSMLDRGPVPLDQAVSIVREIAVAIDYAHRQGVVHCDLKPANVLLDPSGRVLVTDFGFAYLIAGAPTRRQSIGGTPGYLAPEIIHGHGVPTPAADIYALGVLLSTSTANAAPTSAGDPSADGLRAALRSICQRCTAETPAERYPSAKELISKLDELENGLTKSRVS